MTTAMTGDSAVSGRVKLLNPLPRALKHYADNAAHQLLAAGVEVASPDFPSIELGSAGPIEKLRVAAGSLTHRRRIVREPGTSLVLWPSLGNLEPLAWPVGGPTVIVWHDPIPLRRTYGAGRVARRIGQLAANRDHVRILAHSAKAHEDLTALGWRVWAEVPLPCTLAAPFSVDERDDTVLVAGQYKPERDTGLLAALGPQLRQAGLRPRIVGRGWPELPGWEVDARFVSEDEMTEHLSRARVLLLPYRRVYQSDVAVRAAELGTPIVAPVSTNVPDIYGSDWPGLVSEAQGDDAVAWSAAIAAVLELPGGDVRSRIETWEAAVAEAWREFATRL